MTILTCTTDEKARITLPKNFANSTVLVEQVSETELRIRKARVIPEDDLPFVEEAMAPLSDRDRDVFLALLDNPPPPNDTLRRLLTSGHGRQNQGDTDDGTRSVLSEQLGLFAVEVLAIDADVREFYIKYGFVPLADNDLHLFLPIRTIEEGSTEGKSETGGQPGGTSPNVPDGP